MTALLLFFILVVLLYAFGFLPGVMRLFSGILVLALLWFGASVYGWPLVIGGLVSGVVISGLSGWITHAAMVRKSSDRTSHADTQRRIEKKNAEEKQSRADCETEKQRIIQEQVDRTNSISKS